MGETPDQGQYTGVSCGLDLYMTRFLLRELASYVKRHLYGVFTQHYFVPTCQKGPVKMNHKTRKIFFPHNGGLEIELNHVC